MINASEIALRRSIANASKQGGHLIDAIKQSTNEQMDLISSASGITGDSKNLESVAIGLAIQGLELAYHVLSTNMLESKFLRTQFNDECQNDIASFSINRAKEPYDLSAEELAIIYFFDLLRQNPFGLFHYSGIQVRTDEANPRIQHLSILPFFRMSQALQQKNLVASEIDEHRQACHLFLKTNLPTIDYYKEYQKLSKTYLEFEGFVQKGNYLNHFKAPRFMVIAISNLLWNLQYPVDPNTGLPLTLAESVNVCLQAELFLNQLLDDTLSKALIKIDKHERRLRSFFLQIERYIKSLKQAFETERLQEINLLDVSNSMHRALRIMANKIFELIYQKPLAAETLVGQMMYAGELVMQNPNIISHFFKKITLDHIPVLNKPPSTLIDLLIIFCHETPAKRESLINKHLKSKQDALVELSRTLKQINQGFLIPFEQQALNQFKQTVKTPIDYGIWIAKRFIALMAIIMESFTIFEDTRAKTAKGIEGIINDKSQRTQIMQIAAGQTQINDYKWCLSMFLQRQGLTSSNLDEMLHEQFKMIQMTSLMDYLGSLVLENRIFLQQKPFQTMLLDCLKKIESAYQALNQKLNSVEEQMQNDEHIQRHEKRVIQPMLDDLEATLDAIQKAVLQVSHVVSAPDFTEQERQRLMKKTAIIQNQMQSIFDISFSVPEEAKLDVPLPTPVQILALEHLIEVCFDSMSSDSREGVKGKLLIQLKHSLDQKTSLSPNDIKAFVLELIRITASPRPNYYFFTAGYAQTRSCKALIDAILSPSCQRDLKLASIVFNDLNIKLQQLNTQIVSERIKSLQHNNHWSSSSLELHV